MEQRIVVAVSDPLLRRAVVSELLGDGEVVLGLGYDHSLALLKRLPDVGGLVVNAGAWDGIDTTELLHEAKRRRPHVGRTLLLSPTADLAGLRDSAAHAICWAPWEVGQLRGAVRRAAACAGRCSNQLPRFAPHA